MPVEVILPRVDMDMATGKISRWYVDEGASVEKGAALFEIETDKAAMEIEAPASGVLHGVVAASGEEVPVGSTVAWIYAAGEAAPDAGKTAPVVIEAKPSEEPKQEVTPIAVQIEPVRLAPEAPADSHSPRATPLARRLARQHDIDLSTAVGTGPRGRIQSDDVLKLVEAARTAEPLPVSSPAIPAPVSTRLHRVWLRQGEGIPALLIHGFGSELGSWRPLLSGLASPPPVLALDLPGHGRSPLDGMPSLESFVAGVEEVLAAESVSRVHLVGHSLGGAVAAMLAAKGTVDIASLMLIAPAGLGPDIDGAFLSGFLRARSPASLTPWMHRLVSDEKDLPPGFVTATLRGRDANLVAAQETIIGALFPDGTQAFTTRALFDRLAMPTKVIFGADDKIIPARHGQGLPGHVALHVFQGVGHLPYLERGDAVRRLWGELMRSAQ